MLRKLISLLFLFEISAVEFELADKKCSNGFHFEPNICICHPGYELNVERHTCVPKCSEGCVNAYCLEPEICECFDGYVKIFKSYNKCEPEFDFSDSDVPSEVPLDARLEDNSKEGMQATVESKVLRNLKAKKTEITNVSNFEHQSSEEMRDSKEEPRFEIDPAYEDQDIYSYADEEIVTTENLPDEDFETEAQRFETETADFDNIMITPENKISKCQLNLVDRFFDLESCQCREGYTLSLSDTGYGECVPLCNKFEMGCINSRCVEPDVCICFENYIKNPQDQFECLPKNSKIADRWIFFSQFYFITLSGIVILIFIAMHFLRKDTSRDKRSRKSKGKRRISDVIRKSQQTMV